jgi:DsbC/DsbD-like thiol-disulfide interchange protein
MKRRFSYALFAGSLLLAFAALLAPAGRAGGAAPAPQASNVGVNGFFSVDPAQQGSTFQAAVVLDIPRGLHVNGNKPLGKYAVPTTVKIDAPRGLRISPVTYPQARVQTFSFGGGAPPERLAVYEGRAVIRFNVTVPAGHELGVARIRANVRFQTCSDEVCYPPASRELVLPIAIVNRDTPSTRINHQYFGGGRRRG